MRFRVKAGQSVWKGKSQFKSEFCPVRPRGFTMIEMIIVISHRDGPPGDRLAHVQPQHPRAKEAKFQQQSVDPQRGHSAVFAGQAACAAIARRSGAGRILQVHSRRHYRQQHHLGDGPEDPENAWNPEQTGIASVHSGSDEMARDGRPYSSWKEELRQIGMRRRMPIAAVARIHADLKCWWSSA